MTYESWKQMWRIGLGRRGERLGQAFINEFTPKHINPKLFYEEDYWKASEMIETWLVDNCYYPNVPAKGF